MMAAIIADKESTFINHFAAIHTGDLHHDRFRNR